MKIFFLLLLSSLCKGLQECAPDQQPSFFVVTGYVLHSADGKSLIRTVTGINSFVGCLDSCLREPSCLSVNFKTDLCMLFDSLPEGLVKSQYPIFSMFGWKVCIPEGTCSQTWSAEMVQNMELKFVGLPDPTEARNASSLEDCYQQCLLERNFNCKSVNYNRRFGQCTLNIVNRFTKSSTMIVLENNADNDYVELNCDSSSNNICNFNEKKGYIIGTADSIVKNVKTLKDCNILCLKEKQFKCQAFDFNKTKEECRLSHHSSKSLQHSEEAYLEIKNSVTYQLSSCYNVTIDCNANEMIARVKTNKLFNGKIYAKNQPKSCVQDISNSTNFELRIGYNELECNVQQILPGRFSTDVIIQHHDQIITGMDVDVSVSCSFDLYNSSVYNGINISVNGDPETIGNGEALFTISPTVTMQITDRKGLDVHTAKVGDALSLRFHILNNDSTYEIFVRELIALDGIGSSEILLIDHLGCPTDPTIMGPIATVSGPKTSQILEAPFDAFKFPTSDLVQFKALVTPCLPTCEPVNCSVGDYYGMVRKIESYGRRKRNLNGQEEVVVQAIHIKDKFEFNTPTSSKISVSYMKNKFEEIKEACLHSDQLTMASIVFVVTQLIIIGVFIILQYLRLTNLQSDDKAMRNFESQYCHQFYRLS